MRYLGIDFGTRKIGLALSDESGTLAFPHSIVRTDENPLGIIRKICESQDVGMIIVGDSKDFDMKDNKVMVEARMFADRLTKELGLPVQFELEFLTSHEARRFQSGRKEIDSSAAAIILQSYLDKQRS